MKKKVVSMLIAILILSNHCSIVLAQNIETNETIENEVVQNEETNNVINTISMQELNQQREELVEKIQESTIELEVVQEELTDTLNEIANLQQSIESYEIESQAYKEQLSTLQTTINAAEAELAEAEEKCENQENLLKERLVTMYEAGETGYLEFLLTSKTLVEFISNYYLILQMAEWDNKLLEDLEAQKNIVQEKKNALDKNKTDLKALKVKADQNETLVKNLQVMQKLKKEELSEEERVIQEQIDQYRQDQYLIEEQIKLAIENMQVDLQFLNGEMIWPVAKSNTYITSYYGAREHPILGIVRKHAGIDIGNAGFGAPVVAVADGVVSFAGTMGGYGNCVMVNHGNNVTTLYAHGQAILTELGAEVKQGDVIMQVGSTGLSTGPHLHFEVRVSGKTVNPLTYLQAGINAE